MESTIKEKSSRNVEFEQWITTNCGLNAITIESMPYDASFRRYYRICDNNGSYIGMDAIPPQENCHSYIAIANALRAMGLMTPQIYHADVERGFLLISDFGDHTYLKTLNQQNADVLYSNALQSLSILQCCRDVPEKPILPFTYEFMWQEWSWHKEWFLSKWLGIKTNKKEELQLDQCYALITDLAIQQPQVFMHRDYHSANLMCLKDEVGMRSVGILDFQDAFIGPVTYDLVSLLRDCYIDWPNKDVERWVNDYRMQIQVHGTKVSADEFMHWFDWMGVQRHLKALMTFARKAVRDNQPRYLENVPRTMNYLITVTEKYPQLSTLNLFLKNTVQEQVAAKL